MPIFSKPSLCWAALTVAAFLVAGPAVAQQKQDQAPQQNNFGPRNPQGQKPTQNGPRVQQGQNQGPAPEIIATHGDWKIQCGTSAKAKTEGQEQNARTCAMVQASRSEKDKRVGLMTVFVRGKQNGKDVTMMRILAPIGVFLPLGVALEIDGAAIGRFQYTRCRPQICEAFGDADTQTLDKLRKGSAANFIIYEAPGIGVPVKVSLDGFAAAYTALGKL